LSAAASISTIATASCITAASRVSQNPGPWRRNTEISSAGFAARSAAIAASSPGAAISSAMRAPAIRGASAPRGAAAAWRDSSLSTTSAACGA